MVRRRHAWLVAAAAASGCTFSGLDGLTGGETPAAAPDAEADAQDAAVDVTPAGDAADAADAADADAGPQNLLPQGSFESPSGAACGDLWDYYHGTGALDDVAHTGAHACRICNSSATTAYTLDANYDFLGPVTAGEQWKAEAWVRDPSGGTTQKANLEIRIWAGTKNTGGVIQYTDAVPAAVTIDGTWMHFEVTIDVTVNGWFNAYVSVVGANGQCTAIDDVAIYRLR